MVHDVVCPEPAEGVGGAVPPVVEEVGDDEAQPPVAAVGWVCEGGGDPCNKRKWGGEGWGRERWEGPSE